MSQHMEALARADQVRLGRAAIKREIHAGNVAIADALDVGCCQSMRLVDLLMAQRGWGIRKAEGLLSALQIGQARTVRDLTDRQRVLFVREVEARKVNWRDRAVA